MRFSASPVRLTALLTLALLLSASTAVADDGDTCVHSSRGEAIAACTRAINSGRWAGSRLSWAYVNRGNGYRDTGDNDRAYDDYDQAIRLNPKDANAYTGRGNVYNAKGDYDRAFQDHD